MSTPETQTPPQQETWADALAIPLGLFGAMLGAIVGTVVVWLAAKSGFYAIPLVGLGAGLGSILFARRGGVVFLVIAAIVALVAGIITEATLFPFAADNSFAYFIKHFHTIAPFRLLLPGVSVILAGYLAWRK